VERSFAGRLLVATPQLTDPRFDRAVILIIEHDDTEGALGVVLNQPTDIPVGAHLPEWAAALGDEPVVFVGGPVTPEVAIGVADTPGVPPDGWSPVIDDIGLIDLGASPGDLVGVRRARVFAGYAGWTVGQLEDEVDLSAWFVVDAAADDVFTDDPDGLWHRVMGRQPGSLGWYGHYPSHPSVN
jgi:putative transcriptional regulator